MAALWRLWRWPGRRDGCSCPADNNCGAIGGGRQGYGGGNGDEVGWGERSGRGGGCAGGDRAPRCRLGVAAVVGLVWWRRWREPGLRLRPARLRRRRRHIASGGVTGLRGGNPESPACVHVRVNLLLANEQSASLFVVGGPAVVDAGVACQNARATSFLLKEVVGVGRRCRSTRRPRSYRRTLRSRVSRQPCSSRWFGSVRSCRTTAALRGEAERGVFAAADVPSVSTPAAHWPPRSPGSRRVAAAG